MSVFVECVNLFRGRRKRREAVNIDMTADIRLLQKTAGYLEKRGKLKFMNSWKKYWFVLEGHLLLYYGSKDDYDTLSPCRGSITLGHTSTVVPYSAVPLGFQITTRSTTITLRADSVAEQTKWMQAFLSALNPNQNTNNSPTKLNHFRYSSENLNMLEENREDIHGTPSSSPQGKSPQHTPKARESPLIDRLQKLGARSYGNNVSVQNQILEGVKHSRQRSFTKETVADYNRREDSNGGQIKELKNVQLSPTMKSSHIAGSIYHESRDGTKKKEEIILEDEDFCVCALEIRDKEESKRMREEETVGTEHEKSFSFKANMLQQQLNLALIRRRNTTEAKPPLTIGPCLETDPGVKNNQHEETEGQLVINNENESCSKPSEMIGQHELPEVQAKPEIHGNSELIKEFYLHRAVNPESFSENTEIPKPIPKPARKFKNIQNLFLESEHKLSENRSSDCSQKQNTKNIKNANTEPKHESSRDNEYVNIASNWSNIKDGKNNNELSKTKNDEEHNLYAEPNKITMNNCEILTPIYFKPKKERKLKTSHSEPENETPTNIVKKKPSISKGASNIPILSIEHSLDKRHFIKPIQTKTNSKLALIPEYKDETSLRSDIDIAPPVYAEPNKNRKLKHAIKLNADPNDELTQSRDESSLKNSCKSLVQTDAQPIRELKLKNIHNLHTDPRDEPIKSKEKESHKEPCRTMNITHLNQVLRSENICGVPPPQHKEQQLGNIENIYTEPDDVPLNSNESKIEQEWTDLKNIETTKPSSDMNKFNSSVKSKRELIDNPIPIYTEPIKEKKLKHMLKSSSKYNMTDNVLYASSNKELIKQANSMKNWVARDDESLRTEELQCEMDLPEEAMEEFECTNDLYRSPDELFKASTELPMIPRESYKGSNEALPKNWKHQFQFPSPPKDDAHIYAEPSFAVAESGGGLRVKSIYGIIEIQEADFELENELYAEPIIKNNSCEYPEYEELEMTCDNDIYAQSDKEILQKRAFGKPDEVEYSSIPEIDEKTSHYYSQPFRTNEDSNLYEDPDVCQVEKKEPKLEPVKHQKKSRTQRSESCVNSTRTEESKKGDCFIQKLFKQTARKHTDESDKCVEPLPDGEMDETLVMLTEIQQLLEKKKKIIKAKAVQGRQSESTKTHWKSECVDLDKKERAKSYPFRSPDLLKDIKGGLVFNSDFRGLENDYSTVNDFRKREGEHIYSEVVSDPEHFEKRERRPTGFEKFNTWAHGKVPGND